MFLLALGSLIGPGVTDQPWGVPAPSSLFGLGPDVFSLSLTPTSPARLRLGAQDALASLPGCKQAEEGSRTSVAPARCPSDPIPVQVTRGGLCFTPARVSGRFPQGPVGNCLGLCGQEPALYRLHCQLLPGAPALWGVPVCSELDTAGL